MIDGRVYKWKDKNYPEPLVMLGWNFEIIMFAQFSSLQSNIIQWPVVTPEQLKNEMEEIGRISDYPKMMQRLKMSIHPYQLVDKE